jgi:hypothetical protein
LARNLASEPVVQLTTLVKLGPGRFLQRKMAREAASAEDATSGEPKFVETTQSDWTIEKDLKSPLESAELLERFRLVILGRDASEFLTDVAIDNLRSWMSKSGGCLGVGEKNPSSYTFGPRYVWQCGGCQRILHRGGRCGRKRWQAL